jgi:hypothetical protein
VLDDEENLYDHLKVIKLTHAFMLFFHPCWYTMTIAPWMNLWCITQHNKSVLGITNTFWSGTDVLHWIWCVSANSSDFYKYITKSTLITIYLWSWHHWI